MARLKNLSSNESVMDGQIILLDVQITFFFYDRNS